MSINAKQLLQFIIRPTLKRLGLYSREAELLLLGTAAQESHLGEYLHQINGPALGLYEIEPKTYDDIWDNFLRYKSDLADIIHGLCPTDLSKEMLYEQLISNLSYATAICRVIYYRVKEPLPIISTNLTDMDIELLAKYWKTYYNTEKGKGRIDQFIENFKRYIAREDYI